jgi:hypothetical protein
MISGECGARTLVLHYPIFYLISKCFSMIWLEMNKKIKYIKKERYTYVNAKFFYWYSWISGLYSFFQPSTQQKLQTEKKNWKGENMKPETIDGYNKCMRGMDRAHQTVCYCSYCRQSMRVTEGYKFHANGCPKQVHIVQKIHYKP